MASQKKKRKTDKRNHWGRGGSFLKKNKKTLKGVAFYNSSDRQESKKSNL